MMFFGLVRAFAPRQKGFFVDANEPADPDGRKRGVTRKFVGFCPSDAHVLRNVFDLEYGREVMSIQCRLHLLSSVSFG